MALKVALLFALLALAFGLPVPDESVDRALDLSIDPVESVPYADDIILLKRLNDIDNFDGELVSDRLREKRATGCLWIPIRDPNTGKVVRLERLCDF